MAVEGRTAAAPATRSPGRPRKLPYDEREQRILDAACRAFAQRGSTAVSVDAIAADAGINKALVYQHFGSKEELFATAVRGARDHLVDFIAARIQPGGQEPLRARVRSRFHAFLDFAAANPAEMGILGLAEAGPVLDGSGRDALAGIQADYLEAELRAAGLPSDQLPQILGAMFIGMAGSVIRRSRTADWDAEAVIDLLTDFTLAGLRGVDPGVLARADRPAQLPSAKPS